MYLQILTILFLQTFFHQVVLGQLNQQLCKRGEEIVFAFQLDNRKWVSVCQDKGEKYIAYRFGTQKKIELQYPAILDTSSWQQFSFNGYDRGGGKKNAAMYYGLLSFKNNGALYEIYDTWILKMI